MMGSPIGKGLCRLQSAVLVIAVLALAGHAHAQGQPGKGGAAGQGGSGGTGATPGSPGADGSPGYPGGVIVIPPPATPPPAPSAAPSAAPTAAAGPGPVCAIGEYILNNTCTTCVSREPTASTSEFQGYTCRNPNSDGKGTSCAPGTLFNVLNPTISDPTQTQNCISTAPFAYKNETNSIGGGNVQVNLLLPSKGYFTLADLTIDSYKVSSITLAGIPAETTTKEAVDVKGSPRLQVTFKDTEGALKEQTNGTATLTGIVQRPGDILDLCFTAELPLCGQAA